MGGTREAPACVCESGGPQLSGQNTCHGKEIYKGNVPAVAAQAIFMPSASKQSSLKLQASSQPLLLQYLRGILASVMMCLFRQEVRHCYQCALHQLLTALLMQVVWHRQAECVIRLP